MKANGNRYVFFEFSIGEKILERVIIELFYNDCPKTCENFLALCKGSKKNSKNELLSYENTIINRIVKGGYLQGGDLKQISKII